MKTLLISPPTYIPIYNQAGRLKRDIPAPALGLLYLAAMLEKENFEVKVIDMYDSPFKKIKEVVRKEKPNIIGISCFTETRVAVLKVAKLVKEIDKKIIVVIGGSHATFFSEQMLRHYPEIDYIVLGEGEYKFLQLIRSLKEKKSLYNIEGIAFKNGSQIVGTKTQKMIENLDELSFPAHHFVEWGRYIPPGADPQTWKASKRKYATIITSRGCPYRCSFCSTSAFWGTHYRYRSPENIVDEIEMLYEDFGIDFIGFSDDTFTAKMDRVIEICKEILKRNIKIQWTCSTRVNFVNKEILVWMRKAGCSGIYFGVESCSKKILENIKKYVTIEQIISAFNWCKETGIYAGMGTMIGNPGENRETIDETIKIMKKIKPDGLNIGILTIFPNTEIYELAKSKKFIADDYWLTNKAAPLYTVENSLRRLLNFQLKIQLIYYWEKKDFFQFFISLFKKFEITNYLLTLVIDVKKLLKIESFGIYKLLKFSKK